MTKPTDKPDAAGEIDEKELEDVAGGIACVLPPSDEGHIYY